LSARGGGKTKRAVGHAASSCRSCVTVQAAPSSCRSFAPVQEFATVQAAGRAVELHVVRHGAGSRPRRRAAGRSPRSRRRATCRAPRCRQHAASSSCRSHDRAAGHNVELQWSRDALQVEPSRSRSRPLLQVEPSRFRSRVVELHVARRRAPRCAPSSSPLRAVELQRAALQVEPSRFRSRVVELYRVHTGGRAVEKGMMP
jgi:hypothetical protein